MKSNKITEESFNKFIEEEWESFCEVKSFLIELKKRLTNINKQVTFIGGALNTIKVIKPDPEMYTDYRTIGEIFPNLPDMDLKDMNGPPRCRELLRTIGTMENLKKWTYREMLRYEGFGPYSLQLIIDFFKIKNNEQK